MVGRLALTQVMSVRIPPWVPSELLYGAAAQYAALDTRKEHAGAVNKRAERCLHLTVHFDGLSTLLIPPILTAGRYYPPPTSTMSL